MKIKSLVCIAFTCFIALSIPHYLSADTVVKNVVQGEEDWRYLKLAQNAYEEGNYGDALSFASTAKQNRKKNNDWRIYTLENTLRLYDVRKAGDDITDIIPVLEDHNQKDAISIIRSLSESKNGPSFKGSFSAMLEFLEGNYFYPEADYLMGQIYRLEGEIDLAFEYMNNSYAHADKLDIPDLRYDILYELADLSYDTENEADYEKYLLLVLKDDSVYKDSALMTAMMRMISDNKKESVEKFFMLYRCENYHSLQALERLAAYYYKEGETEKALRCSALGCIIAVTKIDSALKSRETDYSYVSLEETLYGCFKYMDIINWGNNNGVWELYYNFAAICNEIGKNNFSNELFAILSRAEPVDYWRNLALRRI